MDDLEIFKKYGYQSKEDFIGKIKTVMDHLAIDVVNLINTADELLKKEASIKAGIIIALSAIETLARWWEVYELKKDKNGERFRKWLNNFVFCKQNKVHEELKKCKGISAQKLWEVRNAIVHSCGLPTNIDGSYFILATNSKKVGGRHEEVWEQIIANENVVYVDLYLLCKGIIEGAKIQTLRMQFDSESNLEKYVKSTTNMLHIYMNEGGVVKNLGPSQT